MKIALGQINPIVGDVSGNSEKIIDFIGRAGEQGADLIVFGELAIMGYPPKDLLLKRQFMRQSAAALERIAAKTDRIDALVGFAAANPDGCGRALYNAAALLSGGRIASVHYKSLLPTYDVFDESRYFEPGRQVSVAQCGKRKIGISICEDLWNDPTFIARPLYHANPIDELVAAGAELLINAGASPFEIDKHELRERLFGQQVAKHGVGLVFCNQVGGNDELIFDGASCVFGIDGGVIARAKAFQEDLLVVDLDHPADNRIEPYPDRMGRLFEAVVLGTRDYVSKCGFTDVVIGVSGGIDSAVTAAIATEALGAKAVHGVFMPSSYTSSISAAGAEQLAGNLDIRLEVIEIEAVNSAFQQQLGRHFAGRPADVTEENVQARIRGTLLMAVSNKFDWLVLATGNKSELSVGYCTLYGDMAGGLAVIGDLPKTMVYELAEYVNRRAGHPIIPRQTIERMPTAELRPNQTDQDALPPYDVLDRVLHAYIEQDRDIDEIAADGFDRSLVAEIVAMVDRNEYKRKQAAPVLKITGRAFGSGRRLPIAARYEPPAD